MTLADLEPFLLWSFVINAGVLLWWWAMFSFAHDWIYQLHHRWFRISMETFDAIHYGAMAIYKLANFMLFLVPFIVIKWIL